MQRLASLLPQPENLPLRRAFLVWLKHVLARKRNLAIPFEDVEDLTEVQAMLATRLDQWEQEIREKALQQGMQQGMEKGWEKGESFLFLKK